MVNLILTTIALVAFLLNLRLLYKLLVLKNKNKFSNIFILLISFCLIVNFDKEKSSNSFCTTEKFILEITKKYKTCNYKKVVLKDDISNNIVMLCFIKEDDRKNKYLSQCSTYISGLKGALIYKCENIIVNPTKVKNKYEFFVRTTENWYFLNLLFYINPKVYHGYFKI
jgi:hypothetical protein